MPSRHSRYGFTERAMLYIGIPTSAIFVVTLLAFLIFEVVYGVPRWGHLLTAAFLGAVLLAAALGATVSYFATRLWGSSP